MVGLVIIMVCMVATACGQTKKTETDTEKLSVGAGIAFESEEDAAADNLAFQDIVLTAADLEGMTEEVTKTTRLADVYAQPSKSSASIGAVDESMNVGIYGLTEDEKWMVVSYNGRVGYIEASAFERQVVQTQTVIVPTTPTNSNNSTTTRPSTGDTNTGSSGTGATTRPGTGTSETPVTGGTSSESTSRPEAERPNVESSPTLGSEENDANTPSSEDEGTSSQPETETETETEGGQDSPNIETPDIETPDIPSDGEGSADGEDTNGGDGSSEGEEPPQDSPPEDPPVEEPEFPGNEDGVSEGIAE